MHCLAHLPRTAALALGLTILGAGVAHAQEPGGRPAQPAPGTPRDDVMWAPAATEVDVDELLGAELDLDLGFTDHRGESVKLGDYFDGERPVLITLNYYRCKTLCNLQLNALTDALKQFEWTPGDQYRIVTISIDPRETSELAHDKRATHLEALGKGDVDWNFLVGDVLQVRMLAAQMGVGYAYDAEQDQYAHPAVLMFVSPDGKLARYVYGLTYQPSDIKFALMEAAEGRVGSTMDKLILSCFHYDASIGKYGPFAMGIMRLGGVLMIVIVGIPLVLAWRRERRHRHRFEQEARA
jgi:protein SCO1/2